MEEADAPARAKPVWTSLDIAKLIVSTLTPLLVFGLGVVVTQQSRRAELAAQERAADADKLARREANRRDDAIRHEAAIRDRQIRAEAYARERALREEGYRRDQALRNEAIAREDRAKAETERAAKLGALYAKRTEFWQRFLPSLSEANEAIQSYRPETVTADALAERLQVARRSLEQARDVLEVDSPYFNRREIAESLALFQKNVDPLEGTLRDEAGKPPSPVFPAMVQKLVGEQYRTMLRLGAVVVASATGFQPVPER